MQTDQPPVLEGTVCHSCDRVAFPPQTFGCEGCGAHGRDLEASRLSGRGTVVAHLTVYEHPNPDLPVPAEVATVQLTEGPVVRALLRDRYDPGTPVTAVANAAALVFAVDGSMA